jgi:hypothetical protein
MTVEIRELVIQAKVTSSGEEPMAPARPAHGGQEHIHEARLAKTVVRLVLEKLRDEGWGPR